MNKPWVCEHGSTVLHGNTVIHASGPAAGKTCQRPTKDRTIGYIVTDAADPEGLPVVYSADFLREGPDGVPIFKTRDPVMLANPPGHDDQYREAWLDVHAALCEAFMGWSGMANTPAKAAVVAIRLLASQRAAPAGTTTPTSFERRWRAPWMSDWSEWVPIKESEYRKLEREPTVGDWIYEVRALYEHPAAAPVGGWQAEDEPTAQELAAFRAGQEAGLRLMRINNCCRSTAEEHIASWLRGQANAEKNPKARAAFIEAHNAARQIIEWHGFPGRGPALYDWTSAPEWAQWAATDSDGARCWYAQKPSRNATAWGVEDDSISRAGFGGLGSNHRYDWRGSLQARPGSVSVSPQASWQAEDVKELVALDESFADEVMDAIWKREGNSTVLELACKWRETRLRAALSKFGGVR